MIGLGVVLLAFGAYLTLGGDDEKPDTVAEPSTVTSEEPSGETYYEEGLDFAREKNWEEAVSSLQRAANADPKNDQFQKALRRAEEELDNQERFASAEKKESEGKLWGAIAQLRKISPSSEFSAEAKVKLGTLETRFEEERISVLEEAIREGRMDDAREEVEELSRNLPESETVKGFAEAIRGGKGSARRFVKRRGSSKAAVAPPTSQKKPSKSSTAAPKPAKKESAASKPAEEKKVEPPSGGKDSALVAKAKTFYRSKIWPVPSEFWAKRWTVGRAIRRSHACSAIFNPSRAHTRRRKPPLSCAPQSVGARIQERQETGGGVCIRYWSRAGGFLRKKSSGRLRERIVRASCEVCKKSSVLRQGQYERCRGVEEVSGEG